MYFFVCLLLLLFSRATTYQVEDKTPYRRTILYKLSVASIVQVLCIVSVQVLSVASTISTSLTTMSSYITNKLCIKLLNYQQ